MNLRLISFGNSTIGLRYDDGRPTEMVDFLFQNITGSKNEEPWTTLRLEDHGGDEGFWLWQDDTLLFKEESFEIMANSLMSQVCFTLAYESKAGLLLHSAAVRTEEKGILLPGRSGAGKSTLTAWLIHHGFGYLSDEMVFVASGSDQFRGFTRPITIKSPARHLLPQLLKKERLVNGILQSESLDMVAPEQFGVQVAKNLSSIDLIIFPHFEASQGVQLARLSKAEAAFELMKCLANARNLEDHGLSEAVRLAKTTPGYSLGYGDSAQAERAIRQLVMI
jgi:hypothetical protein